MGHSDAQESAILRTEWGIGAPPTVGVVTHLVLCTADPEDGTTGVSTATPIVRGDFAVAPAQVAGRTRVQNLGPRSFTNDSGGDLLVTHIGGRVGAAGPVVTSMALAPAVNVPAGAQLNYTAEQIRFDLS